MTFGVIVSAGASRSAGVDGSGMTADRKGLAEMIVVVYRG
jgi:hypothetical protein